MGSSRSNTIHSKRLFIIRNKFCATIPLLACLFGGSEAQASEDTPAYRDTTLSHNVRASDLVSRMTLEEKSAQLLNDAPAIPRLGVREYNWWNEGLHGVAAAGNATVFPQAIGMAATWNTPLIQDVAGVIGVEFRAKNAEAIHRFGGSDWFAGLTVWSPNINIFRDPRWGRGQETYGEDPYLTSHLGVSFIKGLQGSDERYALTVATPKHFAVHSGPESNRHREDVHPSPRDLEETYLPAFRAAIVEGKAQSIMCSYNAVDGIPACANKELLTHYLREQWGFTGFVVSDCDAVGNIYREKDHNYTDSPEKGVAVAFNSGMDLICGDNKESEHILSAVRKDLLSESVLDTSLQRLFTARMRLGQFDSPADVFPKIGPKQNDNPEHRALALTVAQESLVLLKNIHSLLPLKEVPKTIAVIGENADSEAALVGNYNGSPSQPVSILKGIKTRFPSSEVIYAVGSGLLDPQQFPVPDNALCLKANCANQGLMAEHFPTAEMKGSPIKQKEANAHIVWDGERRKSATRWSGFVKAPETGVYRFRFLSDGGYRIWINKKLIVDAWGVDWRPLSVSGEINLKAGKTYPIRVESFQRRDHGDERLVWSLPSDKGVQDAISAAKKADLVVVVAGLTAMLEGEEMPIDAPGFKGGDRSSLDLPSAQQQLLEKLNATGKPIVLVLTNGSPISVNWADKHIPAIIEAWYPGGQGGEAVAGLIAGDFSPAGRLPLTFYRSADQLPKFEDYSMAGRTYRYFNGEALYPFGFGLSYTKFHYSNLKVSKKRVDTKENIEVTVDIRNIGDRDSDEVAQLYLRHLDIANSPIRSLAGFKRFNLKKGQSRTINFTLSDRDLSVVDDKGVRRLSPGSVEVWVGGGQPTAREGLTTPEGQKAIFKLEGSSTL